MFTKKHKKYDDHYADFGDTTLVLKWNVPVTGKCVISRHHMHGRIILYSNVKNGQTPEIHDCTCRLDVDIEQCVDDFNRQIQQLYEPGGQKYQQAEEKIQTLNN